MYPYLNWGITVVTILITSCYIIIFSCCFDCYMASKYQSANNYLWVHVDVDAVQLVSDTQWMTVLIPKYSDVTLQLFACCGTCHAHGQPALACSRLPLPGVATPLSRLSYGHVAATLWSGIRSADRELLRLPMKVSRRRTEKRLLRCKYCNTGQYWDSMLRHRISSHKNNKHVFWRYGV